MSDHQNIQTQWSDGPPKFSALSKIVTWPKNLSNRRHSRPIIQETRYRSRPFSRNKTSVYNHAGQKTIEVEIDHPLSPFFTELKICVHNHAGYELLRPRSTINPADVVSKRHPPQLAPVAETGFSHRLTAYKIVGHFFGLSYWKISGSNQVKNSFFRISNISVPCLHAQLRVRGRTVIISLIKSYGHFLDLGVRIALSHRHVGFFG